MGEAWADDQIRQAKEWIAEAEAEQAREEAAAEAARKKQEEEAAAAARRRAAQASATQLNNRPATRTTQFLSTPTTPRIVRAPSPSPRPRVSLAPPQTRQTQRRKSSSGLGSLFKGALQVTNALLNAENQALAAQAGSNVSYNTTFVDVNSGGGGSIDMSSFWAPINDAANAPIQ